MHIFGNLSLVILEHFHRISFKDTAMNPHFSILLHSLLLIGTLLPLSTPATSEPAVSNPAEQIQTASDPSQPSQLVAFGRGIPASRGGGGTR